MLTLALAATLLIATASPTEAQKRRQARLFMIDGNLPKPAVTLWLDSSEASRNMLALVQERELPITAIYWLKTMPADTSVASLACAWQQGDVARLAAWVNQAPLPAIPEPGSACRWPAVSAAQGCAGRGPGRQGVLGHDSPDDGSRSALCATLSFISINGHFEG